MVGEVRLADREQPRDRGLELVVDPEAAHRIVRGGVDHHRRLPGRVARDPLVHLEQVPVAIRDHVGAAVRDRVAEVEVDGAAGAADAKAVVADDLGRAGGDVAGHEVAEARVALLEVVVALGLRDVGRLAHLRGVARHPHPPVVAEGLGHERELRLVVPRRGDRGWVDLREAGVGEGSAPAVGAPRRGHVAAHGVGREEVDVAVAAGREHHGIRGVPLDLARDEVRGR